jgi:hypothetical protein
MLKLHGQSTKESYRDDIETSRKLKTLYKNYEWMDDYSYCKSTKLGFSLEKDDDEIYLNLFQEDGPKDIETLNKFLEWRRSGKSDEIGHKGGGNKRNIYGFTCEEAFICMKIDDKYVIRCATKPNNLYKLAISDIDEETFRKISDSSTYITSPEKIKIKNLPSWYSDTFNKIKTESGFSPNFLIRMELIEIPKEFTNKEDWNEYINQVRAKQYKIPIYFKNELTDMKNYEKYSNIDLIGLYDPKKICELDLPLFINKITKEFYIKIDNNYVCVKNPNQIINENQSDIIEWGINKMYIVSKEYFNEQMKKFNNNKKLAKSEDFYGIYLFINDKFTNYLPFSGKLLGESKNNGIKNETGQSNNSRFRMIIIPNLETCLDNDIFDSLIQTYDVKAGTSFLDSSDWKKLKDISIKFYKGEDIIKKNIKKKKKEKKEKIKDGGCYIVYLSNGLYKFGMITDHDNKTSRFSDHKSSCINEVNNYIEHLSRKIIPNNNTCIEIFYKKSSKAKADEEYISQVINNDEKIKTFECERSSNGIREYFACEDFDYINDIISTKLRNEL